MARRPKTKDKEHVETLSTGEIPDVTPENRDGEVKGKAKAVEQAKPKAAPPRPPKVFRVLADKQVLVNGYRTKMHAGKEVDELNYNIKKLLSQGVQLQEISQDERARPVGSSLDDFM